MRLYYFNPENDIALGLRSGQRLTLSSMVSRLHRDGAILPMWYASAGDCVLVDECVNNVFFHQRCDEFGVDVRLVKNMDHANCSVMGEPWGWSFDSARRLSAAGAEVLSSEIIESIRMRSHRRAVIEILSRLSSVSDFMLPEMPVEARDISTVNDQLKKWGDVYVKLPWSSSGRGVFRMTELTSSFSDRILGMIRKQGSVMVEPTFDKKIDFAMLFRSESGAVSFVGYSLFFNSRRDSYGGNLMASDGVIEEILVKSGASIVQLEELKAVLPAVLSDVLPAGYEGYFGLDMMVGQNGAINPCVELNLRMTMGVVAHIWRHRYLEEGVNALFRVSPASLAGGDGEQAVIKQSRLQSGCVHLTPTSADGFLFSVKTIDELEFQKFLI